MLCHPNLALIWPWVCYYISGPALKHGVEAQGHDGVEHDVSASRAHASGADHRLRGGLGADGAGVRHHRQAVGCARERHARGAARGALRLRLRGLEGVLDPLAVLLREKWCGHQWLLVRNEVSITAVCSAATAAGPP